MRVSDAQEDNSQGLEPSELVRHNAYIKALAVARRYPEERVVLGADTIVALDGKIYGKPSDRKRAAEMLAELSGKTHSVCTGVALAGLGGEKKLVGAEESRVSFKKLSAAEIEKYIETVNVLDKAGAYAAQEHGSMIIEKIEGNFDNEMGLPCGLVERLLAEFSRI